MIQTVQSALEREQAFDLRRSVFCGELHYARDLVDDGQDAGAWFALAKRGERPVGTLRLRKDGGWWLVELLAVLPTERRQGLGRALLAAATEHALGQGAERLLAVAPRSAQVFFDACGFECTRQEGDVILLQRAF